ncbi:hypothetical protein HNY73_007503 [Argiope bruennichi]|uniref:PiggyBac transposable element-derived protein domain-containing protein n=1 Tax=Argiope bruennichi TaxID=94029 RepID=A0A8T0FL76_ARGBR|nr:hypothetical protein HNY73_007503 [Argiope bruennichi]
MKNKPNKYRLEFYVLGDAESGYILKLERYTGKLGDTDNSINSLMFRLGESYLDKGNTIYMDRFHSSPTLFDLSCSITTLAVETVMKNKKELPLAIKSTTLKKDGGKKCTRWVANFAINTARKVKVDPNPHNQLDDERWQVTCSPLSFQSHGKSRRDFGGGADKSWGSFTYQDVETNCTIGEGGNMYVKLVDIGVLLHKFNPYAYRNLMKHFAAEGKNILSTVGFKIPPKTQTPHYVPIVLAYKFIMSEFPDTAKLFRKQLQEGIAHKHRMRKFVSHEKKASLLLCVEKCDDKCVSVPLWIDQFIKNLQCYRQEVKRNSTTCTSEEFLLKSRLEFQHSIFQENKIL